MRTSRWPESSGERTSSQFLPSMCSANRSHAEFDSEHKNADLVTEVSVENESASALAGATLRLNLIQDEDKKSVASSGPVSMDLPAWFKNNQTIKLQVLAPMQWNAEHPHLYTLETVVSYNGFEIERVTQKSRIPRHANRQDRVAD